jgi:hypothetical protein
VSVEKIRVESNQELEQMVTQEISQVSKDLTVICNNVAINDKTTLDILCHDSNGQLVIVQLSINEDDIMLLHGIQSLDYVDKFKTFLKATYNKHKIDDKEQSRLVLIAPNFSDALRHAVESMKGIHIDLYEWEYLKLGDHKGLRLQPIFAWTPTEKPKEKEEKLAEKKYEPKPVKKKELEHAQEKKEEPKPEPPKKPELPKEEVPTFPPPQPAEESEEEKKTFKPKTEEPPKRKHRLF